LLRERGIARREREQTTGASDPADRLAHLVQDDLPSGLAGQSVKAEGKAERRSSGSSDRPNQSRSCTVMAAASAGNATDTATSAMSSP